MKYSYEHRLVIVQRVKKGEAIAHLSKEYHINETQILAWVRMWDKYGRMGLEKQPHCRPTPALKEKVVSLILEEGVPLAHIRIEYRIGKTALQRWVSPVRQYGYEILHLKKKRGRPSTDPMASPKNKEPQTELEKLQAEDLRLRAECVAKKSEGLSRGTERPSKTQWAKAIDGLRSEYPLDLLLELRKKARSVFYYHLKRLKAGDKHAEEKENIKSIFYEHKGRYGYMRITSEMRNRNFVINHKTVQRLMQSMGIKARYVKCVIVHIRAKSAESRPTS